MPEPDDIIRDLASLVRAGLWGRHDTCVLARRVASAAQIAEDDSDAEAAARLRKALGLPAEDATPTLGGRITTALLEAGFRQHQRDTDAKLAAFTVHEGAGASVSVVWAANDEWRGKVLRKMAEALRAAGFTVSRREDHLYVPDPERADREAGELTDIAYDRTHPDPYRNWVNGEQPAPGTENQP
jgi:hypothetical protein